MCGAPPQDLDLSGVDLSRQAVVAGVVSRDDAPLAGAYVRLLDASGEFVAEVPTSATGQYRFFAASGEWTVRVLAPGAQPTDRAVRATVGEVTRVDVAVA
ncbi:DUF1416 domain-containing protein [Motilibacter aurantiacus]|uniref:DUF1416 domain-containing protein n=1 Tax=Motilibacter aurantiacus TaxID=2714955 RepID=UPI00140D0700|nr:DUF1416 domain-containing protein [Motilibacter aurantiacus]NHC46857.1 DUF1416 domain-containing protein [Motilibacter aurantiacus]